MGRWFQGRKPAQVPGGWQAPSKPLEGPRLPLGRDQGWEQGAEPRGPGRRAPVTPDLGCVPSPSGHLAGHTSQKKPVPSGSAWRCMFLISDLLSLCSKQTDVWAPGYGRAPVDNWSAFGCGLPDVCLPIRAARPGGWGAGEGGRTRPAALGSLGPLLCCDSSKGPGSSSLIQPVHFPQVQRMYPKPIFLI